MAITNKILTTDFRVRQANFFVDNINTEEVFMFAGQTLPYADANSELVENTDQQKFYDVHQEMIFAKNITPDNYKVMIRYKPWQPNVVYTKYDNQQDLSTEDFYVITQQGNTWSVFKCLDNNQGAVSTAEPTLSETSASDEFYQTSDNYVWKLMYTFSNSDYETFGTEDFVPLVLDDSSTASSVSANEVANNAVLGAIDVIVVEDKGRGYINTANGAVEQIAVGGDPKKFFIQPTEETSLAANSGFYTNSAIYITSGPGAGQLRKIVDYGDISGKKYVTVNSEFTTSITTDSRFEISPNIELDGDGSGFIGRALTDSSDRIDRIEVIARGSDYTFADVNIGANNIAIGTDNFLAADLRAIIPPYGGHGADAQQELFGRFVCISIDFDDTTLPIANNDYRTYGLMQNPEFREAKLVLNSTAGLSANDTLTQTTTNATGRIASFDAGSNQVVLANVAGVFDSSNVEVGNTEYSISAIVVNNDLVDQRTLLDISFLTGAEFDADELVIQDGTNAEGYVYEYANNELYLVNVRGNFEVSTLNEIVGQASGSEAIINSITQPDAIRYSGEILYIENIDPITRIPGQSETIKLVIGF